jgi:outer membrane biogenesis lipoprotein LolB
MKRIFLLLASALLTGAVVLAQDMGGNSAASQSSQSNSAAGAAQYQNPDVTTKSSTMSPSVIRGCLSGSSGNYTLTDQNGMQYQVTGDDATLRSMVGREVEISGVENQMGEASNQGGETTSHAPNAVQASDVRAVSKTCNKGSSVSTPPPVEENGASPKGTPESNEPPKPQ